MSATNTINKDLLAWFQTLPKWQNEAFRRLGANVSLEAADIEALHTFACQELGIEPPNGSSATLLTEQELPVGPVAAGVGGRLIALHSCSGVNALIPDQRIEFGPKLTIVYGGNGSGKSGYARILKHACRCNERAVEAILQNIYEAAAAPPPTAKLDVEMDGVVQTLTWTKGGAPNAELRRYSVFDARAARSYLGERNSIPLVPSILLKLEALADGTRKIQERLKTAAAAVTSTATALSGFIDSTLFGKAIAGISADTDRKKLEDALQWTGIDDANLLDLQNRHATLISNGPQALRLQIQQRRSRLATLTTSLRNAELIISQETLVGIRSATEECDTLRKQKKAASELALGASKIEGVGSAAWESMLRAAATFFAETQKDGVFPGVATKSQCMLCQRVLQQEEHSRIVSFWDFLQNEATTKLRDAEATLKTRLTALEKIVDTTPPEILALEEQLKSELAAIWSQVPGHFAAIAALRNAVVAAAASGAWELPARPSSLVPACEAEALALTKSEEALADETKAKKELSDIGAQIAELTARKRAFGARDVILSHHAALVRARRFKTAADAVSTLAISNKAGALQKLHVIDSFATKVKTLAKDLGLRRAVPKIDSKTAAGKVSQAIVIDGCRWGAGTPELVFSEGERTAIALAYFLAEIGEPGDTRGVIFDDPVTSLDHKIRTKVVEKIVQVAGTRQVIVFTHDLPFFCELRDHATMCAIEPELRSIEAVGKIVGLVSAGEPLDAMSLAAREKFLETVIKQVEDCEKKADTPNFAFHAARFYSTLRSSWERAIEELVFNKVVQRYDKAVKTQSLKEVVVDAAVVKAVFDAMTKFSGLTDAHDNPVAANATMPDSAEMKQDWAALVEFRTTHKKKMAARKEENAHL